ncbi:hypothetical protein Pmar_PMAR009801, partial [Perkinsus marinus ATCC 50983]
VGLFCVMESIVDSLALVITSDGCDDEHGGKEKTCCCSCRDSSARESPSPSDLSVSPSCGATPAVSRRSHPVVAVETPPPVCMYRATVEEVEAVKRCIIAYYKLQRIRGQQPTRATMNCINSLRRSLDLHKRPSPSRIDTVGSNSGKPPRSPPRTTSGQKMLSPKPPRVTTNAPVSPPG